MAEKGFNNVLWECGPRLATSAVKAGCIQEFIIYLAPKILGGLNCMTPFNDFHFEKMNEVIKLDKFELITFGEDICLKNKIN